MGRVKITLSCGRYDRTWALLEGRVVPEGVDLNYFPLDPEELFWRMARYNEFDVSEFSLGAFVIMLSRGDHRFVGIPVFPSRFFRHSCIYINVHSGIEKPENLQGKKMGVPDYTMTANTWIRGLLDHEFGVRPTCMKWFTGGLNEPGRKQRVSFRPMEGLSITHSETKILSDMIEKGEIDVLIGAREPNCYREGSKNVTRLWPNFFEVERDYYSRTRIFPIMHLIVLRREIYEKHRWLAQSLCKAFNESKEICRHEMTNQSALRYMLPWLIHEIEDTTKFMGQDYWPYGLEPNKRTLEAFLTYSMEQGLMESLLKVEDLFAPETLDTSRI